MITTSTKVILINYETLITRSFCE